MRQLHTYSVIVARGQNLDGVWTGSYPVKISAVSASEASLKASKRGYHVLRVHYVAPRKAYKVN